MHKLFDPRRGAAPLNRAERWAMVSLWWGTAGVSWLGWNGISHDLVAQAAWVPVHLISPLVAGGICLDLLLGAAWALRPSVTVSRVSLLTVVLFTVLASAMVPSMWWHPLGPLLKNVPILAMLWRGSAWQHQ